MVPPIDQCVLICASDRDEAERFARIVANAGAQPMCFEADAEEALVGACRTTSDAVVILGTAGPRASAVCKRLRALERGDHLMIAVTVLETTSSAVETLLESGADVVWPRGVTESIVASALRRAVVRTEAEAIRSVIDSAPDALFVVSSEGTIRSTNVGVQALLGHAAPALEGRTLWELVDDEGVHLVRDLVGEVVQTRDLAAPAVVRLRRHDETFVEVELSATCMLDDPAIRGVLVTAREASERMSVGAALQEAETRFGAIFDNFLEGLVQVEERSRRLVHANPAFCRMTGRAPDEISQLTLLDLVPERDRQAAAEILDAHFRGARDVTEVMCILHADGTPLFVDLGTTRIELSGVPFVLAVVRDVTARRETERTRELFLAVVAHELRTPVAVLQNSVELLRSRPPPTPSDRAVIVGVIAEEVQRLVGLVADAVDLGSIQAGTFVLTPHRVALAPLVATVVARVAPQFEGRAELRLDSVEAWVDPLRFQQIVAKLVDNAWRHGGAPEIEVSLTAAEGAARLDVVDRGPGLPPELWNTLFERVLLPSERPTTGLGIGLWLTKRLVSTMGGSIRARPGTGESGLAVTVTLPLSEDASRSA